MAQEHEKEKKFRLVTRSDFDGLVCAVLLKELGLLREVMFVHPKDMQDGRTEITADDITTNLPYVPGCHLAFDHHSSETERLIGVERKNHIIDPQAPSAARVVYDYYGGPTAFPRISREMMNAVDKSDSARFTREEILDPHGWVLLNFLMDARTGLGRFRHFRVSNYRLMLQLIDYCREHTVDEILSLPDVAERVTLYTEHKREFTKQLRRCSTVHDSVVVLDLRNEETIYCGNRFVIYALFPEANISVHVIWGLKRQNTVFAIGKSILNRTCDIDIGALALRYGGGGHSNAGTCQVPNETADDALGEVIRSITAGVLDPVPIA